MKQVVRVRFLDCAVAGRTDLREGAAESSARVCTRKEITRDLEGKMVLRSSPGGGKVPASLGPLDGKREGELLSVVAMVTHAVRNIRTGHEHFPSIKLNETSTSQLQQLQ
jgi:hypothetical protein